MIYRWPSDPPEPPAERIEECRHCGAELLRTRVGEPEFSRRKHFMTEQYRGRWSNYHYTGPSCDCKGERDARRALQKINKQLTRMIFGGVS